MFLTESGVHDTLTGILYNVVKDTGCMPSHLVDPFGSDRVTCGHWHPCAKWLLSKTVTCFSRLHLGKIRGGQAHPIKLQSGGYLVNHL